MVLTLERCRDGIIEYLDRCRDGMVLALERHRDGMVVTLERSRDGMVLVLERRSVGMILTLDICMDGMVVTLERCWFSLISTPRETLKMVWFQIPREMLVQFDLCPRETYFPTKMPNVSRGGTTALELYQRLSRAEIPRETLKTMTWLYKDINNNNT